MTTKFHIDHLTHKTDYASTHYVSKPKDTSYISTPNGICEFVGYNGFSVVARFPGTYDCFLFDPCDVLFLPVVGKSLLYYQSTTGRYFVAEVLEVFEVDHELRFRIRIRDPRWSNPVSVLTVSVDDLGF